MWSYCDWSLPLRAGIGGRGEEGGGKGRRIGRQRRLPTHLVCAAPLGGSRVLDTENISLELLDTTNIHK